MASYTLRDFIGGAPSTTLASDITNASTSISLTSGTGFPTGGANGDFFIAIGSLQSNGTFTNLEEIRIASRSGNTLTVQTSGRGVNNTTAVAHTAGETIFHCMSVVDAVEANYVVTQTVGKITAKGDILSGSAANTLVKTAVGSNDLLLMADSAQSGGIKFSTATGTSIGTGVITGTHLAAGAVTAGKIGVGGISAANQFAAGVVDSTALASNAITTVKITDANVTQVKLDATVAKEIVQIVATSASYSGTPSEGAHCYETTNHDLLEYGRDSAWVNITPQSAQIATQETTTSTTYTALTTPGPAVTLQTGTRVLVTLADHSYNSGTNDTFMAFAVSGATTQAAADTKSVSTSVSSGNGISATFLVTGLTAGSNTFTAQYRVANGTGTFYRRNITVVGVP